MTGAYATDTAQRATRVLAFDTSAGNCAVAVTRGENVLGVKIEDMDRGQAERLLVLCSDMLDAAALKPQDLDAIGVGIGPGNFTGVRISVAAARGLALGLGIPAVGVSVLEAMVLGTTGKYRAVVSGRRGYVIVQTFKDGNAIDAPTESAEDTIDTAGAPMVGVLGSPPLLPVPVAIARIAAARHATQQTRPSPLYLRPADAAPARDPGPVILP